MKINIGSIVTHPLFQGPGTVVKIHNSNDKQIVEVFWQSLGRNVYHSFDNLQLITGKFKEND